MTTDLVKTEEFRGNLHSEDLYEMLGVPKDATPKQIRKAYRAAAMKYHPDRNGGTQEAEALFQDISKAYETLSDPAKREFYDNTGMRKPDASKITDNAKDTVLQVFLQIIDQVAAANATIEIQYFDAVKEAKSAINQSLDTLQKMRSDMQSSLSRYQAMQKRFKKKDEKFEDTPLGVIFGLKVQQLKAKHSMSEVDVEVHRQALAYVDEYTCTPDERPNMNQAMLTMLLNGGLGPNGGMTFRPGG